MGKALEELSSVVRKFSLSRIIRKNSFEIIKFGLKIMYEFKISIGKMFTLV